MNCRLVPFFSSKDCFRDGAEVASMVDVFFLDEPESKQEFMGREGYDEANNSSGD